MRIRIALIALVLVAAALWLLGEAGVPAGTAGEGPGAATGAVATVGGSAAQPPATTSEPGSVTDESARATGIVGDVSEDARPTLGTSPGGGSDRALPSGAAGVPGSGRSVAQETEVALDSDALAAEDLDRMERLEEQAARRAEELGLIGEAILEALIQMEMGRSDVDYETARRTVLANEALSYYQAQQQLGADTVYTTLKPRAEAGRGLLPNQSIPARLAGLSGAAAMHVVDAPGVYSTLE